MRTKLANLLKPALLIGALMCCFSCQDMEDGTYITQSYMHNCLYTGAKFKGEDIWHTYDAIDFQTSDSIKLRRYKEAEKWIKKFERVDSFK